MTNQALEIVSKIFCAGLLIFQGIIINAFLSKLYCPAWWSWEVADILVLLIWTICLVVVRRRFLNYMQNGGTGGVAEQSPHEIKYTYIAWLSYITLFLPRVILLFANIVSTLDEKDTLGPNMLKIGISCTPLIFFFLVYGSQNSRPLTARNNAVKAVAHSGAVDLFDSLDLLDFLFDNGVDSGIDLPAGYRHVALTFACISIFIPVLLLYGLNYKTRPGRIAPLCFTVLNVSCNLLLINVPNLIIRSVLWHNFNIKSSVLIMKNVLGITMAFLEVFEYFGESRPVICKKCKDWFERSNYLKHKETCSEDQMPLASVHSVPESETSATGNATDG